jgi:hypothetical protein
MHALFRQAPPDLSRLPGAALLSHLPFNPSLSCLDWEQLAEGIWCFPQLLSPSTVKGLLNLGRGQQGEEVSVWGRREGQGGGSSRLSFWAAELAQALFVLMQPQLSPRFFSDYSPTDWWQQGQYRSWKPIGLSPLLRWMAYAPGSQHFPHYDAAYIYPDARYRSLMSVIFYLSSHEDQGATRFLEDGQAHLPIWQRKHEDWLLPARADQAWLSVYPQAGKVLLFDHRYCHDAPLFTGPETRYLIRADLVFQALSV